MVDLEDTPENREAIKRVQNLTPEQIIEYHKGIQELREMKETFDALDDLRPRYTPNRKDRRAASKKSRKAVRRE